MTGRSTTPQAQTRSRATRSASREVSTSPAQTRRRGGTQANVEATDAAQASGTSRGQKRGKKTATASNLPIVEEDPSISEQGIPTDPQLESPGDLSNVSGTTAVSSTSAQPGETDKSFDDVCYALPHLHEAAEDLLEVLAPEGTSVDELSDVLDELKVPGSSSSSSLKRCEGSFISQRESLTEAQYINPTVFLRSVLKPRAVAEQDTSTWRPDDILYKANLATIAKQIATLEGGTPEAFEVLRDLDLKFPYFFASSLGETEDQQPAGGSVLVQETIDLALLIRTQLFIAQVAKQENESESNAEEVLRLVFFTSTDEDDAEIRGWKFPRTPADVPSEEDIQEHTRRRIIRLGTHIKDGEASLDSLEGEFSWLAFQIAALEWVRERHSEINNFLELRGGARSVVREMKRTFKPTPSNASPAARRTTGRTPSGQNAPSRTQPVATGVQAKKATNTSSLSLLKSLGKGLLGGGFQAQPGEVEPGTGPAGFEANGEPDNYLQQEQDINDGREWNEPSDGADFDQTTDPALLDGTEGLLPWTRAALVGAIDRDKRNQENLNRPRTFIDRQDGAQRLNFGDGFSQATQSQQIASSALARSRNANGKRRAQAHDEDIDPSQDAGFQNDERDLDYDERRRMAPVSGGRAPVANMTGNNNRKRQRFATYQAGVEDYSNTVPYESGEAVANLAGPDGTEPQASMGEQYRRAKALAREATKAAAAKGLLNRPTAAQGDVGIGRGAGNPGKRKWSIEQEGRLIEYIREYGCKWSEIKKIDDSTDDNILAQWSQVDLKDKAINIRVDLLKSRTPEPNNFQYISLRGRDKDKLMAMGIDVPLPVARNG